MALPDFDAFAEMLAKVKVDSQSWGNLLRDIYTGKLKPVEPCDDYLEESIAHPALVHVLSTWDFYSSSFLDQAAQDYGVKSWQVTEYIEAIRERLAITETDLIVFEDAGLQEYVSNQDSVELPPPPLSDNPGTNLPSNDLESHGIPDGYAPQVSSSVSSPPPSRAVLGLVASVTALVVVFVALIAVVSGRKDATPVQASSGSRSISSPPSDRPLKNDQTYKPKSTAEQVYFSGIELPVTNLLCNKKRSFCIYNLARLVENESGSASYTFSDLANGQIVNINGTITIDNIDRSSGGRAFRFTFRDDRRSTTPGWAAAGYFYLDQDKDPAKPGILTKFKTTESFGPKTPIGLENTSYLFPS